jgi:hypothetical protein
MLLPYLGRPVWSPIRDKCKAIFDKKKISYFFRCKFFSKFLVVKTLYPDPDSINPDPKHCFS